MKPSASANSKPIYLPLNKIFALWFGCPCTCLWQFEN
jgi:hypothetical protein